MKPAKAATVTSAEDRPVPVMVKVLGPAVLFIAMFPNPANRVALKPPGLTVAFVTP